MKKYVSLLISFLFTHLSFAAPVASVKEAPPADVQQAFRGAMVLIESYLQPQFGMKYRGHGTGFCIDAQRQWIVTNAHVASPHGFAVAVDTAGNKHPLQMLYTDPVHDFCILALLDDDGQPITQKPLTALPLSETHRDWKLAAAVPLDIRTTEQSNAWFAPENQEQRDAWEAKQIEDNGDACWITSSRVVRSFANEEDKYISESAFGEGFLYWRPYCAGRLLGQELLFKVNTRALGDTLPGDSGSPIILCDENKNLNVIGIHAVAYDKIKNFVPAEIIAQRYHELLDGKTPLTPIIKKNIWVKAINNNALAYLDLANGEQITWNTKIWELHKNLCMALENGSPTYTLKAIKRSLVSDVKSSYDHAIEVQALAPLGEQALGLRLPKHCLALTLVAHSPGLEHFFRNIPGSTQAPVYLSCRKTDIERLQPFGLEDEAFMVLDAHVYDGDRRVAITAINGIAVQSLDEAKNILEAATGELIFSAKRFDREFKLKLPADAKKQVGWAKNATQPWTPDEVKAFMREINKQALLTRFDAINTQHQNKAWDVSLEKEEAKRSLTRSPSIPKDLNIIIWDSPISRPDEEKTPESFEALINELKALKAPGALTPELRVKLFERLMWHGYDNSGGTCDCSGGTTQECPQDMPY